jgi:sugar lactone lactonase YvrE
MSEVTAQSTRAEGSATAVEISRPTAIAINGQILYVGNEKGEIRQIDLQSNEVRRISTSQQLSPDVFTISARGALLVAELWHIWSLDPGTGGMQKVAGNEDADPKATGKAIDTYLGNTESLATDSAGNLFLATGDEIDRIDATTGVLSTIAGGSVHGTSGDGGPALQAGLGDADGVAVDRDGTIYVAQSGPYEDGHRIRRIRPDGSIETLIGPGTAVEAVHETDRQRIHDPRSLLLDDDGGLLFADGRGRVLRVDLQTERVRVIAGSATGRSVDNGRAVDVKLGRELALARDSAGNIFIADYEHHQVRRLDRATGLIQRIAGTGRSDDMPSPFGEPDTDAPPPDAEVCRNDPAPPVLTVKVSDRAQVALPTVLVYITPNGLMGPLQAADLPSASLIGVTGGDGIARFTLPSSGEYAVTLLLHGFAPQAHAARLSTGCVGELNVTLDLVVRPPAR